MMRDDSFGIGGVDLLDQETAAYSLNRKYYGGWYYLQLLFDLIDLCMVKLHIVYEGYHPKGMELLDFKVVASK